MHINKILTPIIFVFLSIILASPSMAVRPSGLPTRAPAAPRPTKNIENKPTRKPESYNLSGTPGAKGKLQSCQAREANIKTRSENLTNFSARLIDTFDKIANRVKDFYTSKGLTVSNYTVLVADIATKKQAVNAALTRAQAVMVGFSCDTDDPKSILQDFNENMKLVHIALKDYKTSVRNLIVAVRSQSPSSSPTRRPTKGGDR